MKKNILVILILALLSVAGPGRAEEAAGLGSEEIIGLLREHYVDRDTLDAPKLDAASVAGILQMLGPGAQLLTAESAAAANRGPTAAGPAREAVTRVEIIEPEIGYIRMSDVRTETEIALDAELKKFSAAKVSAYILDLRFANGTNLAAAAAVASRFLPADLEVFTWKQAGGTAQTYRTVEAPDSLATQWAEGPLMLLVNGETRGSAEVLVGALRARERGIVIGGPTAGEPLAWREWPLRDGRVLRLATAKISLPGGAAVFPGGVIPDIMVKIDPATERDAVFNLATNITLTASLQPRAKKKAFVEADLVRAFRGERLESPELALPAETTTTNGLTLAGSAPEAGDIDPVRDVVLQRAVDILKGIRVLLSWQ
jgi:hypothetical protein